MDDQFASKANFHQEHMVKNTINNNNNNTSQCGTAFTGSGEIQL